MAVDFITAVFELSPYKAEKLLVQLACADWANQDGQFWPSYNEIAKKARVTKPGAIGIIKQMVDDGELVLTVHGHGQGHTNSYQFAHSYLEAVARIRAEWADIREAKGKRGLPSTISKVNQDDLSKVNTDNYLPHSKVNQDDLPAEQKVNENDVKGKREPAPIRKNRHEPSEEKRESALSAFGEFSEVFPDSISIFAQEAIESAGITDMAAWRETMEAWKTNRYSPRNLAGMIDAYRNRETRAQSKNQRWGVSDEERVRRAKRQLERFSTDIAAKYGHKRTTGRAEMGAGDAFGGSKRDC